MSRMTYRVGTATVFAALAVFIVACGPQRQGSVSPAAQTSPAIDPTCRIPEGPGVQDWDNPVPGDQKASVNTAKAEIAFQPRTPSGFGDPVRILVVPPASQAGGLPRGLDLIFDTPTYGRVVVSQSLYMGPSDFVAWAKQAAAQSATVPCGPTSEVVTIRGNVPALLGHTIDRSQWNVRWVEGQVVYDILGPTLTREQVVEIANGSWSET